MNHTIRSLNLALMTLFALPFTARAAGTVSGTGGGTGGGAGGATGVPTIDNATTTAQKVIVAVALTLLMLVAIPPLLKALKASQLSAMFVTLGLVALVGWFVTQPDRAVRLLASIIGFFIK